MPIDLEAIRKKLNQLSGNNSRRNVMWRPQEGDETTVRLLSFEDNDFIFHNQMSFSKI